MPTTLIRVSNPRDPPERWIKKQYDLGLGNADQGFHSAVYVKEPYVYFLGYDDLKKDPLVRVAVLARATIADLREGGVGDVYEFWVNGANGPHWSLEPKNLVTLFSPGNTETGIQYIPEWRLYISFTYYARTPDIYITVAPELTGPWSVPVSIYKVPDHGVSFPISSYAVRSHPEFTTKPGELIISYATNSGWSTKPLFTKEGAEVYFPRFIRVQLELNK
jgi:hypothetical protein